MHFDAARFASGAYADEQARRIGATATIDLPATVPQAVEGDHTTHISVVDKNGLAVAMTVTINVPFGSGLVVPGTSVLLNPTSIFSGRFLEATPVLVAASL